MELGLFVDLVQSATKALKHKERLILLCHNYIQARVNQLVWRKGHDGADNMRLVNKTAAAFNALRKYMKKFD